MEENKRLDLALTFAEPPTPMDLSKDSGHGLNNGVHSGWKKGFWSLFLTQFQGAFSDNVFKFLVIFLIDRTYSTEDRDTWMTIVLIVLFMIYGAL